MSVERIRWQVLHDPEEQPDCGDVLVYNENDEPEWYHLVVGAVSFKTFYGVRSLQLYVEKYSISPEGYIPQEIIDAIKTGKRFNASTKRKVATQ